MPIDTRPLQAAEADLWDRFVWEHPHGSPFHLTAWARCLERTFGYSPRPLVAMEGGRVRGVLPLALVSGLFTGRALISSPFAVYGGVLADGEEARNALRDRARALGEELGVQHVELRNAFPEQCVGWSPIDRYFTFTQDVRPQDGEALLAELPKKTRNMVRKALKSDFEVRRTRDWRPFERLHSLTLRRLGTPSFPKRHFAEIVAQFGEHVDLCELRHAGELAGASLSFRFREQMHIYYAGIDPRFNHLAANYRMYYEHLLWAGQNGHTVFDFGRTKTGSGTYDFKKHWATVMRPLPYEILLVRRRELPNLSPANPKFDLAIQAWQKLPLWLTRAIGPAFVRLFP